jgi:hypothetical protein
MSLVESIKNLLKNPEELMLYRLQAAKFFFIVSTLLFFINYLFLWAGFLSEIASLTFSYTYTALILSYLFYTSLVILYYTRGKMRIVAYGVIAVITLLFVGFLIPVFVWWSFLHLLSF